jgi:hypothetical protein
MMRAVVTADVPAMLVPDFADPRIAADAGFTRETLTSDTIEQCVEWARKYHDPPDASDMLKTFTYYLANDAFPPLPGETFSNVSPDRAFYESLGPETGAACRNVGCTRPSVAHSVRCRVHHFEALTQRTCPFDD